jgi:GNAT superfamily N-acetyltransferase
MSVAGGAAPAPAGAVTVRPVVIGDALALDAFYTGLSAESQRLRFLGYIPAVGESNARSFCVPDHVHSEGFVAVDEHDGRIVGHVCLVTDERGATELAIAVEDASQRRGIGRRLFRAALEWGQARGLDRFTATAFRDNTGMLRLADGGPHPVTLRPLGGGVVRIEIPLEAGACPGVPTADQPTG